MAHEHYPKFLYHATEPARVVHSKDEHEVIGEGWHESPADLRKPEAAQGSVSGGAAPAAKSVALDKMTKAQLIGFAKENLQLDLDPKLTNVQMIEKIAEGLK